MSSRGGRALPDEFEGRMDDLLDEERRRRGTRVSLNDRL